MHAVRLLERQHRQILLLFARFFRAGEAAARTRESLFLRIADHLAVLWTVEEKLLYPEVHDETTSALLYEALEEHLAGRRLIADLLDCDPRDPAFLAKMIVLRDQVRRHVELEHRELFPRVERLLDRQQLVVLGRQLAGAAAALRRGRPRDEVRSQTAEAAPLVAHDPLEGE